MGCIIKWLSASCIQFHLAVKRGGYFGRGYDNDVIADLYSAPYIHGKAMLVVHSWGSLFAR